MNTWKDVAQDILDPFEIEEGWFELEFVEYQVKPANRLEDPLWTVVDTTIERLHLDDYECRELRREYAEAYLNGNISLTSLERRAPFVARELRRQGKLRQSDR